MERYSTRMSAYFNPNDPGFAKIQWTILEDVNVEFLLYVLTTVDASSTDVRKARENFAGYLCWHKHLVLTQLSPT